MVIVAGTLGLGAEARARDIANENAAGRLPSPLTVAGDDSSVAQIVTVDGRVLAHSPAASPDVPVATFQPAGTTAEARTVEQLPSGPPGRYRSRPSPR
jgi:hypothetical protein